MTQRQLCSSEAQESVVCAEKISSAPKKYVMYGKGTKAAYHVTSRTNESACETSFIWIFVILCLEFVQR